MMIVVRPLLHLHCAVHPTRLSQTPMYLSVCRAFQFNKAKNPKSKDKAGLVHE